MKQKRRSRFVKLYFRDQNKIMRAIPNIQGLVRDDNLRKMYTFTEPGHNRKTIYIIGSDEE
tara:strand:+ start:1215 stop:1397 length:183 start_codon:yes stop_codon:yes gene_type:complete